MNIQVIGVHPIVYSAADLDEALEIMRGPDLAGQELQEARIRTREHFESLRLIEIEVVPADAEIDWSGVTQSIPGVDESNWQAPYDEELIDAERGRWAFFLHFIDPERPLLTPATRAARQSMEAWL